MDLWSLLQRQRDFFEERFDGSNITEIKGTQLTTINFGSFDFSLHENFNFPSVESMKCEELCNFLSCSHGCYSNHGNQENRPGNESRSICRCSNSPSFPNFNTILRDMLTTGMACKTCDN